jgi:hypothetical protein
MNNPNGIFSQKSKAQKRYPKRRAPFFEGLGCNMWGFLFGYFFFGLGLGFFAAFSLRGRGPGLVGFFVNSSLWLGSGAFLPVGVFWGLCGLGNIKGFVVVSRPYPCLYWLKSPLLFFGFFLS